MTKTTPVSTEDLKKTFGLGYQIDGLAHCDALIGLRGKDVLEVGGALPDDLVRGYFGARTWIGIDDVTRYKSFSQTADLSPTKDVESIANATWKPNTWGVHDGRIQDISQDLRGRFDVIISIATLEHVDNLPGALDRMCAALKPGGFLYLLVGPIWSGQLGYHIYPSYFPDYPEETKRLIQFLRPWQHLAQTRSEMFIDLRAEFGATYAEIVTASIYESTRLNRLFAEEYLLQFQTHGLRARNITPWTATPALDTGLLDEARKRNPTCQLFDWDGFSCVLQVTESVQLPPDSRDGFR